MSKTDFIIEAKKLGIKENLFDEFYESYLLLIKKIPQLTLQEFLQKAVEAQISGEKMKAAGEYPMGSWWFDEFNKKRGE